MRGCSPLIGSCDMSSGLLLFAFFLTLVLPSATFAQQQTSDDATVHDPTARVFQVLLSSEHLLGDWGGLRPKLEDAGITPRLTLITDVAGNPSGGRAQAVTAPSAVDFTLFFDLEKLAGLKGGSIFTSFSERWGKSVSNVYIGNVFPAQQVFGIQTYRVIDVSYQQKMFDNRVELRLGRFSTMDDFLVSLYNSGLMSTAFCGNPFGIVLDAPGVTDYVGTWAALVKVKPTARSYVMTGVYNGDPTIRQGAYHGVSLSVKGPVFVISEAAYQINGLEGDNSQRLGNYKVGAWYDGSHLTDFETGATRHGSWGSYALFDQLLVPFGSPGSNRGLAAFGSITIAPDSTIQALPVFFTASVGARGLLDVRPTDAILVGVASGYFSSELREAQLDGRQPRTDGGAQDRETVIELAYRFHLRKGALLFQPDFQYIIQPGGTGRLNNASVLGAQFAINF